MGSIGKAEIRQSYDTTETHEASIDWNGNNYLVIYGRHINGWYIAIPNWQISTEAGIPTDTFYNTERLSAVMGKRAGKAIAEAVREHWEFIQWQLEEEQRKKEDQKKQDEPQKKHDQEKLNKKRVR